MNAPLTLDNLPYLAMATLFAQAPQAAILAEQAAIVAQPNAHQAALREKAEAIIELWKELADDPRYDPNLTDEELLICIERFEAIQRMIKGPTIRFFERELERSVPEIGRDYRVARTAALKVIRDLIGQAEDILDTRQARASRQEPGPNIPFEEYVRRKGA